MALGYFTAKTSTGLVGRYIESTMGKPSLVRDTSRLSARSFVTSPVESAKKLLGISDSTKVSGNDNVRSSSSLFLTLSTQALEGIILEKNLSTRLDKIARSTANTKKNRAPYRHLLLHGPPGTGKTMFARNLARNSGLEYAILTGGDVAPLGRDGVTEIHKVKMRGGGRERRSGKTIG